MTDPNLQAFVMYEVAKLRNGLKVAMKKADESWSRELAAVRSLPTKEQSQVWKEFERLKAVKPEPAKSSWPPIQFRRPKMKVT